MTSRCWHWKRHKEISFSEGTRRNRWERAHPKLASFETRAEIQAPLACELSALCAECAASKLSPTSLTQSWRRTGMYESLNEAFSSNRRIVVVERFLMLRSGDLLTPASVIDSSTCGRDGEL